jgi:hypothetical protein
MTGMIRSQAVLIVVISLACFPELGDGSSAPKPQAQNSNQITNKDQSEINAYAAASTQNDPAAKAAALESFLQTYPEGVNKKVALSALMNTYRSLNDDQNTLSAARHLLEADPNNLQAVFLSVVVKRSQCVKTSDAQTCDDAAQLASRGLGLSKPADDSEDDWRKQTGATFPIFHSAIALDDVLSKGDVNAGILEYRQALILYGPKQQKRALG